ncbi:bile salt-activated lipase [Gastrophryne carolinensis]
MAPLGILFVLASIVVAAQAATLGVVYTEGGFVEGTSKKIGIINPDYIDIFKGIPFGAPTKILEKPEKHPGWSGTLKTTEYKPRCLQALFPAVILGDMDCLYLNIWVPQTRKAVSTKLPVMIWIYGGAFLLGGGQGANFLDNYLYDGEEIALRGNVIVVTFNYRVGPLGFLSTGDANAPGNYGLWDQHFAIAWVKRNIAAFGGDPENITIFGESAGGASVSLQTLTPYNVGLIKRAISQSGVGTCPWAIQEDPLRWAEKIAENVGCPFNTTDALVSCLRKTDPKAITAAYQMDLLHLKYPLVHYLPFTAVIDGDFFPDHPRNLFENAANVDFLAGVNNMDGHLFAGVDMPAINRPLQKIYVEEVHKVVEGLTAIKGSSALNTAFQLYTEKWGASPTQEVMKKTVVDLETDYIFLVPTQEALALHYMHAKNARTYSYLFSHPSRAPVYPSWVGADHADDLQYMFGKPFKNTLAYRPQDRDVAKAMIAYWTNFAATGDPNQGQSKVPTPWLAYNTAYGNYLEINNNINSKSMKKDLRSPYVVFWCTTFRNLPTMARWVVFSLALAGLLAAAHAATLGVVYTEGGFVEGTKRQIGILNPSYIDVFKGIPFAAPPRILEKAERHPGWSGTLKAKDYKPRCLQVTLTQNDVRGSTDCLYLNIWVPHSGKSVSTNLPVMVWIYGGAYLFGAAEGANFLNNYLYDGEELALRGNVIVVTFNYRLGPLGFLSTGDANAPGNYGLWDQHMAIAWVKRNIAAFGGNPNSITIFGESAGAASVSLQTLSPHNIGLIKRAISQSGVGLCTWAIQNDPLFWAKQVASKVGCPTEDTAALANCLRASDPKAVTLAYKLDLSNLNYPVVHYLAFSPVVDGDFIPDDPINLFSNAADVDYMAGVNNMDGHLFAGMDLSVINEPLHKISADEVRKLITDLTLPKGALGADIAIDMYTANWGPNPEQELMKKTVIDAETDYIFLVPTQEALAYHSMNARVGKTYSYLFSHPTRMPLYPSWVGADHADDLQYIFGKPFTSTLAYRPQDRDVSGAMIAYWTNFAATGDPNQGPSKVPTSWLPYDLNYGQYLEINNSINYKSMKQSLRSPYVNFWVQTYGKLPNVK